jgi:hypothetical protein
MHIIRSSLIVIFAHLCIYVLYIPFPVYNVKYPQSKPWRDLLDANHHG